MRRVPASPVPPPFDGGGTGVCGPASRTDSSDESLGDDRADSAPRAFTLDATDYGAHMLNQLYEVLTEYGPVDEVWFDGAQGRHGGRARARRAVGRQRGRARAVRHPRPSRTSMTASGARQRVRVAEFGLYRSEV